MTKMEDEFYYNFTNDSRTDDFIKFRENLIRTAKCVEGEIINSNKTEKNVCGTLSFYFNIIQGGRFTKECIDGNVHNILINFIKKFQYPNPFEPGSKNKPKSSSVYKYSSRNIEIAPLRTIVKLIYVMSTVSKEESYLSIREIEDNIFFNADVAKNRKFNILELAQKILTQRNSSENVIENNLEKESEYENCWKYHSRQLKAMLMTLQLAGCANVNDKEVRIDFNKLSNDRMVDVLEIATMSNDIFWIPDTSDWTPDIRDKNKKEYQNYMNSDLKCSSVQYKTGFKSKYVHNRIFFGSPGTGKSHTIEEERKELLGEGIDSENYERVTFYPDYSYANFVGTYKPAPYVKNNGEQAITYTYVPGPFMRVYVNALKSGMTDNPKPYLLIVEEINRAQVAAVFGDVFQLLDRDEDGVSEYHIQASEDVKNYLAKELGGSPDLYSEIKIPDNMFIWATMNSADQGVFPMDTAFKRRWDFAYLGIDDNDKELHGKYVYLADDKSQKVEWNNLRKAINSFLEKEGINEDKQIGPYFISRNIVVPENDDEIDRDEFIRTFKNKVIMYLFEDAARSKRSRIFDGISKDDLRYSKICDEFDKKGIDIFNKNIKDDCKLESLTKINNDGEEI